MIPTVDISGFLSKDYYDSDENTMKRNKALKVIEKACTEYGFFQIINHGVDVDLMKQSIQFSETFFAYPDDEKFSCTPPCAAPLRAGYNRQPDNFADKNEYLLVFPPKSPFNVYPLNPPGFREAIEEVFSQLSKTGFVIQSIVNECLGLPENFLNEYNHDRSWDFMAALHYYPASTNESNGISQHEDGNCITLVFQDDTGGLEVLKNDQWIPVTPVKGTIVVNISDVIQVLSNKKFKSATHRVLRQKEKSRYSYAFFYNLEGDKWVEPLPQFTIEIEEVPKYRRFQYKEYQQLRARNKTHPPTSPDEVIDLTYYAIK